MPIWVLVADSVRARFLTAAGRNTPLEELKVMVNPNERMSEQEFTTDRPGRAYDRMGQGRHAMEQSTEPKVVEAARFAKAVVLEMDDGRRQGKFERLYLVAPPKFLGHLRDAMDNPLTALVAGEVTKDITKLSPKEIRGHLPDFL